MTGVDARGGVKVREGAELLRAGMAALENGRPREAAEFCKRAMKIDPARPETHFLIGLVAIDMGDQKTAVSAFGSVTKLDPGNAAAFAQLARLFMRLGMPARAEQALASAKALDPKDPAVADLIGVASSMLGDQEEARRWYERAVNGAPESDNYAMNYATGLMYLGENDRAVEILNRMLAHNDNIPQANGSIPRL